MFQEITIPETRWTYGIKLCFTAHYWFVELRMDDRWLILNRLTGRCYTYPFKKYPDA